MIYSARNTATGAGTVFHQLQFDFIPNQDLVIKRFLSSAYVLPAAPGPNISWGHLFAFGNNLGDPSNFMFTPPNVVLVAATSYAFLEYFVPANQHPVWIECNLIVTSRRRTSVAIQAGGAALAINETAVINCLMEYEVLDSKQTVDPIWEMDEKKIGPALFNPI